MNNAVTWAGLLHAGLLVICILSLAGTAWFWLNVFASAMSDGQPAQVPWMAWMIVAHALPVVLFALWWVT